MPAHRGSHRLFHEHHREGTLDVGNVGVVVVDHGQFVVLVFVLSEESADLGVGCFLRDRGCCPLDIFHCFSILEIHLVLVSMGIGVGHVFVFVFAFAIVVAAVVVAAGHGVGGVPTHHTSGVHAGPDVAFHRNVFRCVFLEFLTKFLDGFPPQQFLEFLSPGDSKGNPGRHAVVFFDVSAHFFGLGFRERGQDTNRCSLLIL
mmetsp:Transcript_27042/g.63257  ORF Transcript_27042/g.63257 Transcript_27042/m.63257 type:complete len:202 (+) Transcript_27042:693-1298(+)